jgi:hypothetical protein
MAAQEELTLLKKRRIFAISEDATVEYESTCNRNEALKIALTKLNDERKQPDSGATTSNEETVDGEITRQIFLKKMEKALIEFHGVSRVIQLLKTKEHLSLLTCTRPSNPIKGSLLSVNQRVDIRKKSFQESGVYLSEASQRAAELVNQRRQFANDCLVLRKNWRLILSPNSLSKSNSTNLPSSSLSTLLLTHRDEIAIDCSQLTAGDMTLVNKQTVPLPVNQFPSHNPNPPLTESKEEDMEVEDQERNEEIPRPLTSREYYTLQYSLSHVHHGVLCSQTLWNILHTEVNPLRETGMPPSSTELISWRCRITQHDVSVRSFFASLIAIERESRLLNTESVLYDIWNTVSSTILLSSSTLMTSLFQDPLTGPLQILSHTRSQIIISISSSLQLSLTQVPLFQSSTSPAEQISFFSPFTPSVVSPLVSSVGLSGHSLLTMISCAGLAMESILLTAQCQQHAVVPPLAVLSLAAQSPHSIESSHCLLPSYTPLSHEHNWNTFLFQPSFKQKQTPASHFTFRRVLLSLKEICQAHLLFHRFLHHAELHSSSPSPSPLTPCTSTSAAAPHRPVFEFPARGLSAHLLPVTSPQYYSTSHFICHLTVSSGHWKHNSLSQQPHLLTLHIYPTHYQLETPPPSPPSPHLKIVSPLLLRADTLLIPSSHDLMRRPQSSQVNEGSYRFESSDLLWEYLLNQTM